MRTHFSYILASVLLLGLACSCSGGTEHWDDSNDAANAQGLTYDKAKAVIEDMATVDWESPADYDRIKEKFIDDPKSLEETERIALRSSLNRNYADQLIRTAGNILNSGCEPRHSTLSAAMTEYNSRDFRGYVPANAQQVKDAYALHQKQMQFSISSGYGVALRSFLDSYNAAYDTQKRQEAASIRATNPTCSAINKRVAVSHIDEVLKQRKQKYYWAIVNKFCNTPGVSFGDRNRVLSIISGAKNYAALKEKVNAHWDNMQLAPEQ